MDKYADICNECESELLAENKQLKEENRIMTRQKGVACLKHDLIHKLKCGACYDDMVKKMDRQEGPMEGAIEELEFALEAGEYDQCVEVAIGNSIALLKKALQKEVDNNV